MQTTIITFNKSNWTGEVATIEVTNFAGRDEFYLQGADGDLVELRDRFQAHGWTQFTVYVNKQMTGYKVGKSAADAEWECIDSQGDFGRFGKTAAEAVAKVLFNVL
jgi:hypothetical protein